MATSRMVMGVERLLRSRLCQIYSIDNGHTQPDIIMGPNTIGLVHY
jgi:hypothetical protein